MLDLVSFDCLTKSVEHETYITVRENYLKHILMPILNLVRVDEKWYREEYKDVDGAIKAGAIDTAKEHYVSSGYFEGRRPRKFFVDDEWYLKTYPDVAGQIADGKMSSAQEHFDTAGFGEGRLASAGWHL